MVTQLEATVISTISGKTLLLCCHQLERGHESGGSTIVDIVQGRTSPWQKGMLCIDHLKY